jgi:5'(3')-deoxyribonucleotidase
MWIKLEEWAEFLLNELAREQLKYKLLADINIDMTICKIEWWDIKQYLNELCDLLQDIIKKNNL